MDESPNSNLSITGALQGKYIANQLEIPAASPLPVEKAKPKSSWRERIHIGKIVLFFLSLLLFVLAITLMKDGSRSIAPRLHNTLSISNIVNGLGFGWLFAYIIMSGSPVAASALTFFDAGIIDRFSAFGMITGSRLGASFIVLFIGFLYVLRGRDRSTSLSMGLLSLLVTFTTYLPGFFLGLFLLQGGWLDKWQLHSGVLLQSIIDQIIDPLAAIVTNLFPDWAVFLCGLGIILLSFSLFDKCMPQMTLKESHMGWMSRLVYRPVVMFLLGALVTMISMSVSLSLSILVPLSARGFVRRENVIPYIMGANITTFIDTLLAAVLLGNSTAFTIIFVGILGITIISLVVLFTMYRKYSSSILKAVTWITANNRNLVIFMILIFVFPVLLVLL
jgi:sodium-dependent phosphate cotransporter